MKFPNLHIVWTAGKNLALPDTLSRNTPPELLTRKTTVEIPKNIKFYLAENETSPRLECKYAVKTDVEQSQINNLQHFPLYLDCQNNHYEVDLLGTSTFKPIPYSQWIKNNTQQKRVKQHPHKKDLFPLIEKENLTDKINLSGPQTNDSKYTISQVFKPTFNISNYTETQQKFLTMFNFQHSQITQDEFDKLAKQLIKYSSVYALSKFDVGKLTEYDRIH